VPGATEDQPEKIQAEFEQAENELVKQHLADVLRTAFESNEELFGKMKETGKMSEAVKEEGSYEEKTSHDGRDLYPCRRFDDMPSKDCRTGSGNDR